MKRYYYDSLEIKSKNIVKEKYKEEYKNSIINTRLTRLLIYSIISYAFGIILIIYSYFVPSELLNNLFIIIPLFVIASIFMIGRSIVKKRILNKIALKLKI